MSDRRVVHPELALRDYMVEMERATTAAKRRMKWPSGVPDDYNPDSTPTIDNDDYTTTSSFTLDPGRWVLFYSVVLETDVAPARRVWFEGRIYVPSTDTTLSYHPARVGIGTVKGVYSKSLTGTITVTEATDVYGQGSTRSAGAYFSGDYWHSRLTAVPG
jgi:hypothetical protein